MKKAFRRGQAVVNRDSGARSFPIAENFARPARPPPTRQWLPYQGSWREAPERLYYMPRFHFALRFPAGYPSCNLSVTCGDTSPSRRGLGRPGKPCCPHRPTWAQSSGPCSHWQRLRDYALPKGAGQAVVNRDSGARSFPIAENFARPARPPPTRQWLPYQGSWQREAMTERLYYMPRFHFALRFPESHPPCNLSVTFGDTSPGRRGLGIP